MMNNLQLKFILPLLLILFNFSNVEAKCKFIMDIGEKYKKSDEKKFGPLSEDETGYAEVEILAPDVCSKYNFDDNFRIKHIFLDQKLMAIQFYADNSIDNSPTESMKLMDYAKRNYGDVDTGGNPKYYNDSHICERVRKFIVYNRHLEKETWQEEIYISNDKYGEQLALRNSLIEGGQLQQN